MSYIDGIWERTNLQKIVEFVLHGTEKLTIDSTTYKERLESCTASMRVRIKNSYTDDEEREDADNDFSFALETYAEIYTEMGMKIGAKLLKELLSMDDGQKRLE